MLEALGISPDEEATYRALLRSGPTTLDSLSAGLEQPVARVRQLVVGLEAVGLASRTPDRRCVPTRPDVAIEALVQRRVEQLHNARLAASVLLEEYRSWSTNRSAADLVEVVTGREVIRQRMEQLQLAAQHEWLGFDVPPYVASPEANVPVETARLEHGVTYRVIYDRSVMEIPGMLDRVMTYVAAGEEARVLADVPMKLAISDREFAVLPLSIGESDSEPSAILVHSSSLLTALVSLFEALWTRAIPIGGASEPAPGEDATRLLTLLTAGLTDDAIARQLGVSRRTVQRRIKKLQDAVEATDRLSLVLQASRRGMI